MPHCCLCSIVVPNTFIAYQLVIWLTWCEAANDDDSFSIYGQAAWSALVGNGGFFFCGRHLTSRKGFSESTIPGTPIEEWPHCFTEFFLIEHTMLLFGGLSNSLENRLAAAIFLFPLAYLAICARCLPVNRPYDLQGQVFALAFCFLTDNYVSLPNHGWWYIGRKQAGRVRKMSVGRLAVMKQCHTTSWTPRTSAECATSSWHSALLTLKICGRSWSPCHILSTYIFPHYGGTSVLRVSLLDWAYTKLFHTKFVYMTWRSHMFIQSLLPRSHGNTQGVTFPSSKE